MRCPEPRLVIVSRMSITSLILPLSVITIDHWSTWAILKVSETGLDLTGARSRCRASAAAFGGRK